MAQTWAVDVTPRNAVVTKCTLSSLTRGTAVDVTHNGPLQVPDYITYVVTTKPSDSSVVTMTRTTSSDSAANQTARITFHAELNGGTASLSGFVVDVFFHFWGVKAGGIG